MILLHAVLLFSVLLPALSAPNHPRALAKVNEIRARALTNRARLRNNAAKITNQLQSTLSTRYKRQYYPQPPPPPPPAEYQNVQYVEPEPELVHICPIEDDEYTRSAEEHGDVHLIHAIPKSRKRKPPAVNMQSGRGAGSFPEDPLDADLQELTNVREMVHRFEDSNLRQSDGFEQRPNSKFLSENIEQKQQDSNGEKTPRVLLADNTDLMQTGRGNGGQDHAKEPQEVAEMRAAEAAADPHLHSHYHAHRLPILPVAGLHIAAHHALHRPPTSVNVNINQNQAVHSGVQPLIHHSPFNANPLPAITQISPIQNTVVSGQTHPLFTSRLSDRDVATTSEDASGQISGQNPQHDVEQNFEHIKINGPHHGSFSFSDKHDSPRDATAEAESLGDHGHYLSHFPPHHGPDFHHRPKPHDFGHDFEHKPIKKPHHSRLRDLDENLGNFRDDDAALEQTEERAATDDPIDLSDLAPNHMNFRPVFVDGLDENRPPIFVKRPKSKQLPDFEPSFWHIQTNRPSGNVESNDINSFPPFPQSVSISGPEDFDPEEMREATDENRERVASPTFKKKKMKKTKFIPIYLDQYPSYGSYYDNYGSYYREAEGEPNPEGSDGGHGEESTSHERETERVASPTFKKKKMKKTKFIPIYVDRYPTYGSYYNDYEPYYRQAETEPDLEGDDDDHVEGSTSHEREASPTFKKLMMKKMKKMKFIPIYYQQYPTYGSYYDDEPNYYREAEVNPELGGSDDDQNVSTLDREASPTHKKYKKKFKIQLYPTYVPHSYGNGYGRYRDAEDIEDDLTITDSNENRDAEAKHKNKHKQRWPPRNVEADNELPEEAEPILKDSEDASEDREAEATHKKKRKHKFPHRSAEEPEGGDGGTLDQLTSSNYLFNFPARRRFTDQYKRSTNEELHDLLGKHRRVVDALDREAQNDEDLKFVADLSNRTLTDLEDRAKKITKRSIPLTRLISDPNVRLDVPQTLENFGTATKQAVEDERAPMYHLKQMLGSSKNAFLSAMRIPPQNMIIPSDYEIVKSSEFDPRESIEDDDANDHFSHTFRRVGQMVRQGIKSSQDTATHLGDAAHSARNVLHTARFAAPRLIRPYSQIPAIQNPKTKRPNKAILLTPRILDLAEETSYSTRGAAESRPNFVRFGHLTDAVGLSKPNSKNLELQKIVFEPRRIPEAKANERLAQIFSKFKRNYDGNDVDTVGDALNTLEDAKVSVGAQSLRDFLVKMRHELTGSPHEHKKIKFGGKKQQERKEMGKFIETLFDGTNEQSKNGEVPEDAKREKKKRTEDEDDVVGDSLFLPPELMHPFMGRPSEAELKTFLTDNGDVDIDTLPNQKKEIVTQTNSGHNSNRVNHSDLGSVLGAINPLMFERLYNQSVSVNNNGAPNPEEMFQRHNHHEPHGPDGNDTVAASFGLKGPLEQPFMGKVPPEQIQDFLDTYNQDQSDYIDMEE